MPPAHVIRSLQPFVCQVTTSTQQRRTSGEELGGIASLGGVGKGVIVAIQVRYRLVLLDQGGELQITEMAQSHSAWRGPKGFTILKALPLMEHLMPVPLYHCSPSFSITILKLMPRSMRCRSHEASMPCRTLAS